MRMGKLGLDCKEGGFSANRTLASGWKAEDRIISKEKYNSRMHKLTDYIKSKTPDINDEDEEIKIDMIESAYVEAP